MRAKGYSLWLMPKGEVYDRFSDLIKRLARKYNTPIFEPHVTLLGEIIQSDEDVLWKTEQLVLRQKPFSITLRTIDYQDYYFRALFVRADRTDPLQALHDRAKKIFDMKNIPDYMPHLSLMYGNFSQSVKEQIIKTIGRDKTTEFTVNGIHVFKTDGEVNTWYRVKEFIFK